MKAGTDKAVPNGRRVFVVGNGMSRFLKPGKHQYEYTDLATIAVKRALDDSKINRMEVEQIYVGYTIGDSCAGQKAAYSAGMMTGVPIVNVNNNCATGSTALYLAHGQVLGGLAECAMALGFEKMHRGSLKTYFNDRVDPLEDFDIADIKMRGSDKAPRAPKLFGNAGREHMEKHGTRPDHFAKVALKNRTHGINNPYS